MSSRRRAMTFDEWCARVRRCAQMMRDGKTSRQMHKVADGIMRYCYALVCEVAHHPGTELLPQDFRLYLDKQQERMGKYYIGPLHRGLDGWTNKRLLQHKEKPVTCPEERWRRFLEWKKHRSYYELLPPTPDLRRGGGNVGRGKRRFFLHVPIDVFGTRVLCFVGDSIEEHRKDFEAFASDAGRAREPDYYWGIFQDTEETAQTLPTNCDGATIYPDTDPELPVIYMREFSERALVHETTHAVAAIMRSRGLEDGEHGEVRAHLTDYIFNSILGACRDYQEPQLGGRQMKGK